MKLRAPKKPDVISTKLVSSGDGVFRELDGAAPRRFSKEVLRVGSWLHPGTGEELDFSREHLLDLALATNEWIAAGNKVWFPTGTPSEDTNHNAAAIANLGYWTNFRLEGDLLMADVEVLDDSAAGKIGQTIQDVSVGIRGPQLVQDGRTFDAVIYHVAATPQPAIPGQSNFQLKLAHEGGQELVFVKKPAKRTQHLDAPANVKPDPSLEKKINADDGGDGGGDASDAAGDDSAANDGDYDMGALHGRVSALCEILERHFSAQPTPGPSATVHPVSLEGSSPAVLKKIATLEAENAVLRDKSKTAERRLSASDVITQLEREGYAVGGETKKLLEAAASKGESLDPIVSAVKTHAPKLPVSASDLAAASSQQVLDQKDPPEVQAYPVHQRDQARSFAVQFELIQEGGGKPLKMGLAKFLEKNVGRVDAARKGA